MFYNLHVCCTVFQQEIWYLWKTSIWWLFHLKDIYLAKHTCNYGYQRYMYRCGSNPCYNFHLPLALSIWPTWVFFLFYFVHMQKIFSISVGKCSFLWRRTLNLCDISVPKNTFLPLPHTLFSQPQLSFDYYLNKVQNMFKNNVMASKHTKQ